MKKTGKYRRFFRKFSIHKQLPIFIIGIPTDLAEFFKKLFDSSDWPPRWHCGRWTEFHGWLYIFSDLLIWSAYFTIPVVIIRYVSKKQGIRFERLYFLFAAFILACGATHFLDAVAFWIPAYRLSALVRLITGVLSWITVFSLVKFLPAAFSLKSLRELEAEIEQRKKAEKQSFESEEQVQAIFSAAPDAVIIVDDQSNILKWNLKAESLFGWKADEVMGRQLTEIIIPHRFREAHKAGLKHFLKTGEGAVLGTTIEIQALNKNNIEFDVSLSISPTVVNGKYLFIGFVRDLTGQKKSEGKFKGLLEAAPDAMIIVNEQGEIILVNQQTETLFGYLRQELLGKPIEILIPADFKNKHVSHRTNYFADPKIRSMGAGMELYAIKQNGIRFPVEVSLSPLVTEEGTVISASVRDITDRKRAQEEIAFMAGIVEESSEPIYHIDTHYIIKTWNKGAEKLYGFTATEVINKSIIDVVRPQIGQEELQQNVEELKQPGFWNGEIIQHKKDGTLLYVLTTSTKHRNLKGELDGFVSICHDITDRKKAEEALSKLNAELEHRVKERTEAVEKTLVEKNTILESIADAFFAVDKNWTVTYWNRIAERDLGVSKQKIVGKDLWEIFSDSIDSESYQKYHLAIKTGEVVHFEDYYAPLNRWYEISAYPSENGLSVYFKNITERKKAENEIFVLNAELEEKIIKRTKELQNANMELEAFSYSVSHDLRAPLRSIIGFTTILEEDYASKLDEEAKRIASVIKDNTLKMGRLIDDLLAFSRMGRQNIIKIYINTAEVVNEVINELTPENEATVIEWDVQELPAVKGDINIMRQVWVNLISNAIKYSRNGKRPRIEIGSFMHEEQMAFFIKDNGVGFDLQYKDKLFKVFQRLHRADEFEGTGIGLALVEKIIGKHGGKVWAEGEVNNGATFYFCLPDE